MRSRLSRRIAAKTRKNIILSIFGVVIVIFIAVQFGIPILIKSSLFIAGLGKTSDTVQENSSNSTFISAPILNSLPEATSSAEIEISGIAGKDQKISIYINGELINKIDAENDGTFSTNEKISKGKNTIKVKAIKGSLQSETSNLEEIYLKNDPPPLSISSPQNNESFDKDQKFAEVKGTTDPDVRVTVNSLWAITDSNGNFSYRLPLKDGENVINIIATDDALNKTEKQIKVTYSP
jgi:uncharacterized protein YfaP (DUF2135 family)